MTFMHIQQLWDDMIYFLFSSGHVSGKKEWKSILHSSHLSFFFVTLPWRSHACSTFAKAAASLHGMMSVNVSVARLYPQALSQLCAGELYWFNHQSRRHPMVYLGM